MSAGFRRNNFEDLNPIEKKLLEIDTTNDIIKLFKVRKLDTIAKIKLEHGYTDAKLREDLGNNILDD